MSWSPNRCAQFILLATSVLVICSDAHAANRRWNGAAVNDDNFGTLANWVGGFVPGTLDVAQFGVSGGMFQSFYTVTFNNNATNQALHIEDDLVTFDLNGRQYTVTTTNGILIGNQAGGFSGQLTVLDGTVSSSTNIDVGAAASTSGTLIVGAGGLISGAPSLNIGKLGTGTLTVQADGDISSTGSTTIGVGNGITGNATIIGNGTAGSATLLTGTLNVGSTGSGTVNVQLGGLLENSGAAVLGTGSLFTGVGTGIVNVMNAGSVWNSLGLLEVGDGGSGEVNITLGGKVTGIDTVIGANINGGGEVNVNGLNSLWDNSGDITVGGLGSGTLNITNQGVVVNTNGFIGSADFSTSNGTVNVSGTGSQWINANILRVGANGTGALSITAGGTVQSKFGDVGFDGIGTVTVDGVGTLWDNSDILNVGFAGEGTLSITGGGRVQTHEGNVDRDGHVTVNGDESLFQTDKFLTIGGLGQGTLEITGGADVVTSHISNPSFSRIGGEADGTGHVIVDGNGSRWRDFTNDMRVGDLGDGTLEITAGGSVQSFAARIGTEASGSGHVMVSGVGSQWTNQHQPPGIGGTFVVGDAGEGTLEIAAGGTVIGTFSTIGSEATGTGLVTVDGVGSQWLNFDSSEGGPARLTVGFEGTGTLHITNGGTVTIDGDASIGQYFEEGTGTVTVSSSIPGTDSVWEIGERLAVGVDLFAIGVVDGGVGTLRIQPGGTVSIGNETLVSDGGLLSLEGGTLTIPEISFPFGGSADANFQWTSGTLHAGIFQGDLTNSAGILAPGSSIGATEIVGNYNQLTNATLEIEIGPVGQGAQNDSVSATGTATIDGQLSLSLINGADPLPSQTFIILDAATLLGSFDNIANGQRLTTSDGLGSFLVQYGAGSAFDPNQIVLSNFLTVGLPGDYNQNGTVDAADYTLWRDHLGQTFTLTNENPAAATPGVVDAEDYAFWKSHFGDTPGSGSAAAANAAVPEPATISLALLISLLTISMRRASHCPSVR